VWPGDIKFVDVNGDKKITIDDRVFLGSPLPKFTFGFNNTFQYRGIELTVFLTGSYGNKIFNEMKRQLDGMTSMYDNQLVNVTERAKLGLIDPDVAYPFVGALGNNVYWYDDVNNLQVVNPGGRQPRAIWSDPNMNKSISDRYIEDGSYIRIQNITLGYNFPSQMFRKLYIENIRVYANIQNVYTFTKYSGFDPEIGQDTGSNLVYGVDLGRYPSPRISSMGISITF
jgi:hypothetical protein